VRKGLSIERRHGNNPRTQERETNLGVWRLPSNLGKKPSPYERQRLRYKGWKTYTPDSVSGCRTVEGLSARVARSPVLYRKLKGHQVSGKQWRAYPRSDKQRTLGKASLPLEAWVRGRRAIGRDGRLLDRGPSIHVQELSGNSKGAI